MSKQPHLTERDLTMIEARLEEFEQEERRTSNSPRAWAIVERLVYVDVPLLIAELRAAREQGKFDTRQFNTSKS
jgi:hypothetical protein